MGYIGSEKTKRPGGYTLHVVIAKGAKDLKNGERIELKYRGDYAQVWYRPNSKEEFQPLTLETLARKIPMFNVLVEEERQKRVKAFIKNCEVKWSGKRGILDTIESPTDELHELQTGARLFFQTPELFENHEAGYQLVAMGLTSARCESLQEYLQDFQPVLHVRTCAEETVNVFVGWIHSIEPRQNWAKKKKQPKVCRTPVLDYRNPPTVGRNLLDFDCATIKPKKAKKVHAPIPYDDVLIAVIGADVKQIHALEDYTESAGLILVNSAKAGYEGTCLSDRHLAAVDDELFGQIQENSLAMASVFDEWRCDEEDAWADQIVKKAKASFGKPDSRYRSVVFDPAKLQNAVFLEVLRSFSSFAVDRRWVTQEEADAWLAGASEVFAPRPSESRQSFKMEDPDVFLKFLKGWCQDPARKLAALDQDFSKREKHEGAIREIGGVQYLVLPEEWLFRTYLKEARKAGYDCTFADKTDWTQKIQRMWCESDILKHTGSGYRYRYDLLKTGSRDSTYVLAIPLEKIE